MTGSFGRASLALLVAAGAMTASVHACKEPTQVTVDIKTLGFKCSELKRVSVVVAAEPNAAEDNWRSPQAATFGECEGDYDVGTLVVTPSGTRGAVLVLASYSDQPCEAPAYVNCIVARRQFSFIDNVPLRLPITLEASCKNVPCNALSSCRSGSCVSSEADCNDTGTCVAPAEPVIADDGGTIPPPADATLDIAPNDAFVPPDNYVPPEAGFDAGPDGKPPKEDSGIDSGPTVPGNDCPTPAGAVDCFLQNKVCCAYMYYYCGSYPTDASPPEAGSDGSMTSGTPALPGCDSNPSAPALYCTGRKHCAGTEYCCVAAGTANQASACVTGSCTEFLCNGDSDCPSPMKCNTIKYANYYDGGGGPVMKCGP